MKRTRQAVLALAAVGTCLMTGLAYGAPLASAAELTGAGSTLVAPFEAIWAQEFERETGTKVTYAAVGSGHGIAAISGRTVDFGASDAPLTSSQAAECKECVEIPWALTATGVAYNIPGVSKLRLSGPVIAEIFEGKIKQWNAGPIKKLNPGVKLPKLAITTVHRSDGSGDTYAFTNYLSKVSQSWAKKIGYATSVNWPGGVAGEGNSGVTAVTLKTKGSIAYIAASYILSHALHAAEVENAAGKFEYPNLKNIAEAAATIKKVPANNEEHIVDPPKSAKDAFPISTFTYVLIAKNSNELGLVKRFVKYAMTTGQKYGPPLDFTTVPKIVYQAALKTLNSL
ncbi:MAG: phosphate ABC transporter substrate-binding protein PstS [Solirubrobacteraceae bacterium]